MTEERYNAIRIMSEEELARISEAEYREYRSLRYLKLTDQDEAIAELMSDIAKARDGTLPVRRLSGR